MKAEIHTLRQEVTNEHTGCKAWFKLMLSIGSEPGKAF